MQTMNESVAVQSLRLAGKCHRSVEALRFISTDKVVGVLGQYPELTSAVRDRDLSTVSALCARLFTSVVANIASNPQ